jgi:hypothetical protein
MAADERSSTNVAEPNGTGVVAVGARPAGTRRARKRLPGAACAPAHRIAARSSGCLGVDSSSMPPRASIGTSARTARP